MTTVRPVPPRSPSRQSPPDGEAHQSRRAEDTPGPGERLRRLERRRRLLKEELFALGVLLLMLATTLGVLLVQWLSGSSAGAA